MAFLAGLFTLGKDAELRSAQSGDPVAQLTLAYNYGRKGADGKQPTQWIDASLWGERAEKLDEYLTKGKQFFMQLDDVHIETYEGRNGPGHKLVGRVSNIEFTRGERQASAPAQAPAPAPRPQRQAPAPAPRPSSGFDDMDSEIPF